MLIFHLCTQDDSGHQSATISRVKDGVADAANLVALRILQCTFLPSDLFELTGLLCLRIEDSPGLTELPKSLGDLKRLRQLEVIACAQLSKLPRSLGELEELQALVLQQCPKLAALPENIDGLSKLTRFVMEDCKGLKTLPASILKLPPSCELVMTRTGCCDKYRRSIGTSVRKGPVGYLQLRRERMWVGSRIVVNYMYPPLLLANLCDKFNITSPLGRLRTRWADLGDAMARVDAGKDYMVPETMADLQSAYRRSMTIRGLLVDRDSRRQSFENLSIVAVLLATAAFVAFASAPTVPDVFSQTATSAGMPATAPVVDLSASSTTRRDAEVMWLRRFFIADQLAFSLAMTVVVLVLVSSGPQSAYSDGQVQAARVWVNFAGLSLLLFSAVTCGIAAFFFAAHSVYPDGLVYWDVDVTSIAGLALLLIAAHNWRLNVVRIFPGWRALRLYARAWYSNNVLHRPRAIELPPDGADELLAQMLAEVKRQNVAMQASATREHAMLEALQGMRAALDTSAEREQAMLKALQNVGGAHPASAASSGALPPAALSRHQSSSVPRLQQSALSNVHSAASELQQMHVAIGGSPASSSPRP